MMKGKTRQHRSGVELREVNRGFPAWAWHEVVTLRITVPRSFTRRQRTLNGYVRTLGRLLSELRTVKTKTGRTWRLP